MSACSFSAMGAPDASPSGFRSDFRRLLGNLPAALGDSFGDEIADPPR